MGLEVVVNSSMRRNKQKADVNWALNKKLVKRENVVFSRAFERDCKIWGVIRSPGSESGLEFWKLCNIFFKQNDWLIYG